jgi:predicted transglutaminase-like cysteine proteinase
MQRTKRIFGNTMKERALRQQEPEAWIGASALPALPAPPAPMRLRRYLLGTLLLSIAIIPAIQSAADIVDFSSGLIKYVSGRFGKDAPSRLYAWQELVRELKGKEAAELRQRVARSTDGKAEMAVLRKVNDFFNRVPFAEDIDHWGVQDYWATPVEMLASNGGDCEDYAIGKYFTLKELGVPVERMRITYVTANIRTQGRVPHMVLAYYPAPDSDPWILDNLIDDISPASRRGDLQPVYSFNDDDIWAGPGPGKKGGASQVRLWRDVQEKVAREQKM